MNIILGPGRCQDCGTAVWYATASNGKHAAWRDGIGRVHACPDDVEHPCDTPFAGVSGQSDIVADGRPSLLTPEVGRPLVSVG